MSDGEADVLVARRQRHDPRGGRGLGRDDVIERGIVLVVAQPDERQSGAEGEGEGVVVHAGGGARWTSMTARPSSTPRT